MEEVLPALPINHFYVFDGIRLVPCTRLASLIALLPLEHDSGEIRIELFSVDSEPGSWEEYSRTIRALVLDAASTYKNWNHLKFITERNKNPLVITNIYPEKDTLRDIFIKEAHPLPKSFRFDGDPLNCDKLISSLGLEDGDSIEVLY